MQNLISLFPFVLESKKKFEHQNKLLGKVTLTGKINADASTTNLFEFADNTSRNFAELQENLINILIEENINRLISELKSKAIMTIDILIRNLFERTADVGFLATDNIIVDFLNGNVSKEITHSHLKEYVAKYSVYNEIIIFDTQGKVKINLNEKNNIHESNDPLIIDTLNSNSYIERYAPSDFFKTQEQTLTYSQKIVNNTGVAVGVLCLCFKFEDEMQHIFKSVQGENETIALCQYERVIASSNTQAVGLNTYFKKSKQEYIIYNSIISIDATTSGYQGFKGLDLFSIIIREPKHINQQKKDKLIKKNETNENIKNIIEQADNIVDDLGDIIINGELIAAKRRMYLLNPILDNLRVISANLLSTIKDAGESLEELAAKSLKFSLVSSSKLSIDIMDRNLYERANDSRWWALTPLFKKELALNEPNTNKLHNVLEYINDLYTVYTNIFIYDTKGKLIASSKDVSKVGTLINDDTVLQTLKNKESQKYFVSKFVETNFYNNEATYIYHASIYNENKILGGIAVVFDAKTEFKAILDDNFPKDVKGFSLFVDEKCMVISSTDKNIQINTLFPIESATFAKIIANETFYGKVTVNEKEYILASTISKGYREYKVSDNYHNTVVAMTLSEA